MMIFLPAHLDQELRFRRFLTYRDLPAQRRGDDGRYVCRQKSMGALPKDYKERKRRVKELMQARYPNINVTDWSADALGILTWAQEQKAKARG